MGIYIKGMQMPTNCMDCPCLDQENGICQANADKEYVYSNKPSWCPLVEVKPHGRLIDIDDIDSIVVNIRITNQTGISVSLAAPTIIESEGEDGNI